MKIRPVGDELFHAGRHDEANSRFSKFCERAWTMLINEIFASTCYPIQSDFHRKLHTAPHDPCRPRGSALSNSNVFITHFTGGGEPLWQFSSV